MLVFFPKIVFVFKTATTSPPPYTRIPFKHYTKKCKTQNMNVEEII